MNKQCTGVAILVWQFLAQKYSG